ncbi:unnamed protein product, partial [Hapterophycus canaliculatus]
YTDYDTALARYHSDGSLDTRFGSFTDTVATNPTFIERGSAVVLAEDAQFFDVDISRGEDGFSNVDLLLFRNGGSDAQDVFSATGNLSAINEGGNLALSGTTIGTVVTNSAGTLNVRFNSVASQEQVNEVLQAIAYSNNSNTPPASVQIDWSMEDSNSGDQGIGGNQYATGSTVVNIQPSPDLSITAPATTSTNEDVAFVYAGGNVI